ncbi:hypothetical protein ACI00D_004602, partial [Cronobacter dublinensis]
AQADEDQHYDAHIRLQWWLIEWGKGVFVIVHDGVMDIDKAAIFSPVRDFEIIASWLNVSLAERTVVRIF